MSTLLTQVAQQMGQTELPTELLAPGNELASLIEGDAYVGEVFSIGYDEGLVQIHDFNRQQVGGIPALSFLLATRITPGTTPDIRKEILLWYCFASWIMPISLMLRRRSGCVSRMHNG
jgi:hypothetical protein